MSRIKSSSFLCGNLVALVAVLGVHNTACVANQPGTSIGEGQQTNPATPAAAQKPAGSEASQAPAGAQAGQPAASNVAVANVEDSRFPLPMWRNARFEDVNNLAGVLLRTEVGTVQIKQLQWGVDQQGYIYICSVAGFTREGESVVLGSSEGCTSPASKEDFLGTAMTRSEIFIQSFDFGTDYEGYLALMDVVIKAESATRAGTQCAVSVIDCASVDCTGDCGVPVAEPPPIGITGSELGEPLVDPVECTCLGGSGTCEPVIHTRCAGECPAMQSCKTLWDGTCECR